jgi:DeoR family suf operon transcriptional repressor
MDTLTPGLAAHRGLRGEILLELKKAQPRTAQELAERHGVTANAIRRHLKELEAEQLIDYERVQRGQGAPTFTYRLSDRGEALFPKRYEAELTAVLDYLEKSVGRDAVRVFFEQRFRAQADEILARLGAAPFEARVTAVVEFLSGQGFMPNISVNAAGVRLAEHNCAMHAVAQRFPEVCETELEFLTQLLGPGVQRDRHIVSGCNACEYAITQDEPADGAGSSPEEHA